MTLPYAIQATASMFFEATITLNHEQIKALPTKPVVIVPVPGAGQMIIPIVAVFVCDATAARYSNFNSGATVAANSFASSVYLAWDAANNFNDATGPVVAGNSNGAGGLLNLSSRNVAIVNGVSGLLTSISADATYDIGTAIDISIGLTGADLSVVGQNNNLGNFQGGNPANTLKVTVLYAVVDV